MAECNSRFWPGTRTYMMSNRTNPPPHIYTAALTANAITSVEKAVLVGCVQGWPGGSPAVKSATVGDIQRAQATG